jgi:hypothetical protein
MKKLGTIAIGYQVRYCIAFASVHITLEVYILFSFSCLSAEDVFFQKSKMHREKFRNFSLNQAKNADAENK